MVFLPFYQTYLISGTPAHSACRFWHRIAQESITTEWKLSNFIVEVCTKHLGYTQAGLIGSQATDWWNKFKVNTKLQTEFSVTWEYVCWTGIVLTLLIPSTSGLPMWPLLMLGVSVVFYGTPVPTLADLLWPFWLALTISVYFALAPASAIRNGDDLEERFENRPPRNREPLRGERIRAMRSTAGHRS